MLSETCESLEKGLRLLRQQIGFWNELWDTSGNFIVTMPDGMPIRMATANETFVKVIELIGVERVYHVENRPPSLITTEDGPRRVALGQYYVDPTANNTNKVRQLLRIAAELEIELKVEIATDITCAIVV